METQSDLEAPLLVDSSTKADLHSASTRSSRQRGKEQHGHERKVSDLGRWKFNYQRYITENLFAEADHLTEGQREYNRKQRETLAGFEEVDSLEKGPKDLDDAAEESKDRGVEFAINISNIMNVILLVVKIYASVQSRSLAIVASTLDSLLDLLAGMVLWFAHSSMQSKNQYKFPIGKLRVQPVGIVVFAATMTTLGVQVLVTGVQQLTEGDAGRTLSAEQRNWLIVIMGSAIAVKLALYIYCRTSESEIVLAYAQDHFFDVVTNVVGLAAALLADRFFWWLDPVGAIFLALYTIINWGKTVLENAMTLVGQAAPTQLLQKLTYMAFNHHPQIRKIDTVRAYTFGNFYFVEVDIELPEDMPLVEAHNIGESLQNKLETLPEVERAFVHLDYESTHTPEHLTK
ncbi:hypothetical protein MPTK1_5g02190 [Marchantia polymorpha subsp. ruderalis]|uniref:Cation efflux protein cytoplasmic domain-containing protein n=2 Tax=Marchantia polymorpha TaxID=3197 RepID=A0AAF6BE25_MARPO|nr:hypothetical protein MARPO_0147s0012 [Marchantia polymorpha]BBN10259.1 hypothetical protein Mp_5g02190 [Marchantia polymorpha subsp. ruderalis]|eukprot:PTQ29120.1 hypothetical protein MARPO_0147s0012 [Marchantia polymorpha]